MFPVLKRWHWILLCCAACMMIGWSWPNSAKTEDDLTILLQAFQPYYTEGPLIQVHYGQALKLADTSEAQLKQEARSLSNQLGMPSSSEMIDTVQDNTVYTIESKNGANDTVLKLSSLQGEQLYMSLRITCSCETQADFTELYKWMTSLEERLAKQNLNHTGHIMLQGQTNLTDKELNPFWAELEKQLKSELVEVYQSGSTVSRSYNSSLLNQTIRSGSKPMNLQTALHQHSESGDWRLTIGTPIITIEY